MADRADLDVDLLLGGHGANPVSAGADNCRLHVVGIHPDYMQSTIVCACGNRVSTMSTQEEIHVEICSICHPFYTGKQKLVDTAGRVDRFKRKYQKASQ